MDRMLRTLSLWLALALAAAGCDPAVLQAPVEDIRYATGDASAPSYGDAGTTSLDHDAGSTMALGDAGSGMQADLGAPAVQDGGESTHDVAGGCSWVECGAVPATPPACFDGATARVVCAPFVDGSCAWQFACGL